MSIAKFASLVLFVLISGEDAWAADVYSARRGIAVGALVGVAEASSTNGSESLFKVNEEQCSLQFAERLRKSRVELVRLVVNPLPVIQGNRLLVNSSIDTILKCVNSYLQEDIAMIVDFHFWTPRPVETLAQIFNDAKSTDQYQLALQLVAKRLAELPHRSIALELLSEPPVCDGRTRTRWVDLQPLLLKTVRAVAPVLPVILTGCGGQVTGLIDLDIKPYAGDENLIYTFHFYEPLIFTHQFVYYGANMSEIRFPQEAISAIDATRVAAAVNLNTISIDPARRSNTIKDIFDYLRKGCTEAVLLARFQQVDAWARRNDVKSNRIFVGEFGVVIPQVPPAGSSVDGDALVWLRDVRNLADKFGYSYAWWIIPRPSAWLADPRTGFIRQDVLAAIGLSPQP